MTKASRATTVYYKIWKVPLLLYRTNLFHFPLEELGQEVLYASAVLTPRICVMSQKRLCANERTGVEDGTGDPAPHFNCDIYTSELLLQLRGRFVLRVCFGGARRRPSNAPVEASRINYGHKSPIGRFQNVPEPN
ncbi:hypothetical protein ANN_08428 [Periplaneta americana]|uniref:Uncharacterized protein n=1 Tax=Periplaneta americana TaxID=6978 RepID=A0ABQ8T1E1_PERAM|nr:hypothetical protein ANN_08428 [Periplaneta americana]